MGCSHVSGTGHPGHSLPGGPAGLVQTACGSLRLPGLLHGPPASGLSPAQSSPAPAATSAGGVPSLADGASCHPFAQCLRRTGSSICPSTGVCLMSHAALLTTLKHLKL